MSATTQQPWQQKPGPQSPPRPWLVIALMAAMLLLVISLLVASAYAGLKPQEGAKVEQAPVAAEAKAPPQPQPKQKAALALAGQKTKPRGPGPAPAAHPGAATLGPDEYLHVGKSLASSNGKYNLENQSDGNLVVYGPGRRHAWKSDTWVADDARVEGYLHMDTNGDLVLYHRGADGEFVVKWSSQTGGQGKSRLELRDNGGLAVVRLSDGAVLWSYQGE